jgi:hypothetical protein
MPALFTPGNLSGAELMIWAPLILSAIVQLVGIAFFAGKHAQFKVEVLRRLDVLEETVQDMGTTMTNVQIAVSAFRQWVGGPPTPPRRNWE